MGTWDDLPPELRLKIFDILANEARRSKNLQQYRRTSYAVVCREWQLYFEPLNFRQLTLSNACVSSLNERVPRDKRLMVEHIWLRIEVGNYICMACHGHGLSQPQFRDQQGSLVFSNDVIFTRTILRFLRAVSSWDFVGRKGITFELSIHSRADSEHFFRNRTFQPVEWTGDECWRDPSEAGAFRARKRVHMDARHCFAYGLQLISTDEEKQAFADAKVQLLGCQLLGMVPFEMMREGDPMPCARVISDFVMRRQYHRYLNPSTLGLILDMLPALQSLHHEFWSSELLFEHLDVLEHHVIKTMLPTSLRRLSLFEECDTVFRPVFPIPREAVRSLGVTLADHSINLQKLALTCFIDAKDFFAKFIGGQEESSDGLPYWPNMTELALVTNVLRRADGAVMELLVAAGRAAERMPKLETLKMWYSERYVFASRAAVFRYDRSRVSPDGRRAYSVLTLENSWKPAIRLTQPVVEQWRTVARRHPGLHLVVETDGYTASLTRYSTTLRHLRLRHLILHPVSLFQIGAELETYYGNTFILP